MIFGYFKVYAYREFNYLSIDVKIMLILLLVSDL